MRKLLLSVLALLCQTLAFADGSALLVTLRDGTTATYVLSEKPTVTFGATTMTVMVSDASTVYERGDVGQMTFIDAEEAGIAPLSEGSTYFEYKNNTVRMQGAAIQVYTPDGTLVKEAVDTASLDALPDGVYIIRMNRQSVKVIKK